MSSVTRPTNNDGSIGGVTANSVTIAYRRSELPSNPASARNEPRLVRQKAGRMVPSTFTHQSQFFQGALPLANRLSNRCLSRNVSIGCQKP